MRAAGRQTGPLYLGCARIAVGRLERTINASREEEPKRTSLREKGIAKSAGKNVPITLEQATAEEIRSSLGITPTAMRRKALYKTSQGKKSNSILGRGKGNAAKRSARSHGTKKP